LFAEISYLPPVHGNQQEAEVTVKKNKERARLLGRCLAEPLALLPLDGQVADHAAAQDAEQDVHLDAGAQHRRVGERDDEAERLPHAVIAERRLLFVEEDDAVKGCPKRNCIAIKNNQESYRLWP